MSYGAKKQQLEALEKQMGSIREQIIALRRAEEPQKVSDYELTTAGGEKVKLASVFGDKKELFVVHNMGRKCPYCTLWADGFNGILPHLESRAAFVVTSPDAPEIQAQFAKSRDWKFRMASTAGSSFAKDLGYQGDDWTKPGVSVFIKSGDQILRVSDSEFGPGDDFCQAWHMFDLLPKGADGWQPKFGYRG